MAIFRVCVYPYAFATAQADPDTAQADTAQADALTGNDTPPSAVVTGTTALLNPENVPTRAVQAAWFGGFDFALPNDSAPAAKMTIRLEGLIRRRRLSRRG